MGATWFSVRQYCVVIDMVLCLIRTDYSLLRMLNSYLNTMNLSLFGGRKLDFAAFLCPLIMLRGDLCLYLYKWMWYCFMWSCPRGTRLAMWSAVVLIHHTSKSGYHKLPWKTSLTWIIIKVSARTAQ